MSRISLRWNRKVRRKPYWLTFLEYEYKLFQYFKRTGIKRKQRNKYIGQVQRLKWSGRFKH